MAIGALVFSILVTVALFAYTSRAIEQARLNAIAEAERARVASDRGLCETLGLFYSNPRVTEEFRDRLYDTLTDKGCAIPPIVELQPTPTPTPR